MGESMTGDAIIGSLLHHATSHANARAESRRFSYLLFSWCYARSRAFIVLLAFSSEIDGEVRPPRELFGNSIGNLILSYSSRIH